jgi:hypothetical protein
MKTFKIPSTLRRPLLLTLAGLSLSGGSALAADLPYDTQARVQAVLAGTTQGHAAPRNQATASRDSTGPASAIELQAVVRQFILGSPGSEVSQTGAAELNATTISPAVRAARLDARSYADAERQVQRTLQGGAG